MAARAHWSSRLGFILAAAGSAVGLGNIWKFPYMAGENGGGAFVAVYLLCVLAVGLPILIAEVYIGRESQRNVVQAFEALHRPRSPWRFTGWLGLVTAFLILSFYSVVGGWVLDFLVKALTGELTTAGDAAVRGYLDQLFHNPWEMLLWHTLFMALTIGIVARGIAGGIERANRLMMPALFLLLLLLVLRAAAMPGFGPALAFLFSPRFEDLTWSSALQAAGQAFFSLSLGMGAMITYGSYLNRGESIPGTTAKVAVMDTLVSMLAGVMVFSVVFTFGQEPAAGPSLMFVNLPLLFQQMTGGYFVAVAFFLLVAFAALTSAISLLEVVVAYADEVHGWPRPRTAVLMGGAIYALGILAALSFNVLSDVTVAGHTFFDLFDDLTSNLTLPLGGLLIALFYGWLLGRDAVRRTFTGPVPGYLQEVLLWSVRVLAPAAVAYLLVKGLVGLWA
ncbi:MAG: sodium-dependent transporter [Gammaproteobacteria bacterium]|nr:sodium-dependent transporter [Gammaproteobacteria bacterium]